QASADSIVARTSQLRFESCAKSTKLPLRDCRGLGVAHMPFFTYLRFFKRSNRVVNARSSRVLARVIRGDFNGGSNGHIGNKHFPAPYPFRRRGPDVDCRQREDGNKRGGACPRLGLEPR